jgi:hypothetical protein
MRCNDFDLVRRFLKTVRKPKDKRFNTADFKPWYNKRDSHVCQLRKSSAFQC